MASDLECEKAEKAAGEWIREQGGEEQHPVRGVWDTRVLPALRATARRENTPLDEYRERLTVAARVIWYLHDALHYGRRDENKREREWFWTHQTVDLFRANDDSRGFSINREALLKVAAAYIDHPEVQNAPTDWYLLDALVFAQLDAIAEGVMTGEATGTINWAWSFAERNPGKYYLYTLLFSVLGFGFRYVLLPAIAVWLVVRRHEGFAIAAATAWILYVVFRLAFFPRRWKVKRKMSELVALLIDLYAQLGGSVISPTRFREAINKAAAAGVAFDGALFAIADRVAKRDETAFVPFT